MITLKRWYSFLLLHLLCADCSSGVRSVVVAFVSIVLSPGRDENPYFELRTCLFLEKISRRSWVELQETVFDLLSLSFREVRVKVFFMLSQHTSVDIYAAALLSSSHANRKMYECRKDTASSLGFISWIFAFLQGSEVLSQDGALSIHADSYGKAGAYMCVGAVPSVPGLTSHATVNLTIKGNTPDTWLSVTIEFTKSLSLTVNTIVCEQYTLITLNRVIFFFSKLPTHTATTYRIVTIVSVKACMLLFQSVTGLRADRCFSLLHFL